MQDGDVYKWDVNKDEAGTQRSNDRFYLLVSSFTLVIAPVEN